VEIIAVFHRMNPNMQCIPIAKKISQHIVDLPTHTKISEDYVSRLAQFLKKNRDNIYSSFEEIVK